MRQLKFFLRSPVIQFDYLDEETGTYSPKLTVRVQDVLLGFIILMGLLRTL